MQTHTPHVYTYMCTYINDTDAEPKFGQIHFTPTMETVSLWGGYGSLWVAPSGGPMQGPCWGAGKKDNDRLHHPAGGRKGAIGP